MRGMVGGVGGKDFRRIGREVEVEVEVDDGIAAVIVGDGVCIETRCILHVSVPLELVALTGFDLRVAFDDIANDQIQVD